MKKFIADATLGRLARWLRLLGYDTLLLTRAGHERIREAARTEGRIIMTKDRRLHRDARDLPALLLLSDDVFDQLRELHERAGIELPSRDFLHICSRCNGSLAIMNKRDAEGLVPSFIFNTVNEFSYCGGCGKIYWGGSHISRMTGILKKKKLL